MQKIQFLKVKKQVYRVRKRFYRIKRQKLKDIEVKIKREIDELFFKTDYRVYRRYGQV